MDATISNPVTVLAKFVGKKTCELNSGERVEIPELPKKIKSGMMIQLLVEQGEYSFLGLVEKTVQEEKVQEKTVPVEKPYKFINFLGCNHSYILNRDGKIYSRLEKAHLMHLNWDGKCPDPECGGKDILASELFRRNDANSPENNIFSLIEKTIQKEQKKRELKSVPNKTVFFPCGFYAWVNKNLLTYHNFENGQELSEDLCPIHGEDHKYGFGETFFKLFSNDGKEL